MTHIFTIDVEEWFDGIYGGISPGKPERRLRSEMEMLLDILRLHGVSATFFWLGKRAEEYPEIVRQCAQEGHEIGCHGMTHSGIPTHSAKQFYYETELATNILAELTGNKIDSYRAPYFSISRKNFWALEILAGLGYKYDSSIFPIRHWRYGIPDFSTKIQTIHTLHGPIVEIPLPVIRFAGQNIPATGGAYFRLYPYAVTFNNIIMLEKKNGPFVFYLHPWELDKDHPRVQTNWKIGIIHYLSLGSTIPKLHRLLSDFSFTTIDSAMKMYNNTGILEKETKLQLL